MPLTTRLPISQVPGEPLQIGVEFFDDFVTGGQGTTVGHKFATDADAAEWLVTADNGGSNVISDAEPGGVLTITPGTGANDFRSLQLNGEAFATRSSTPRRIIFEARVKTNDADDIKFFVGLATTDATGNTAGPILDGATASIGFRNTAGNAAAFDYVCESASTETTAPTGKSLADDVFTILRFEVHDRDRVDFFVNGKLVATAKSNIPLETEYLTPTLEVGSPTGTTATNLKVDYVYVYMDR